MTENIVTGKKYRILTDATQDIWDRISFWTKASDVYYDDNSNAEANRPIGILKRGTAYVVGTVAYEITAPSWVMLKCTTAGTTAASTPSTYKTISSSGTVITDGTAKFTVYDIRPTTTLSTNAYSVPTVSLLNTQISNLSKSVDYTSSLTIGTNSTWTGKSLRKMGNICQLQTNMAFNIANTGSYSLGYVPADCRPKVDVSEIYPVPNGSYATITIQASDGQILVYATQSLYQWSISVHMMYMSN